MAATGVTQIGCLVGSRGKLALGSACALARVEGGRTVITTGGLAGICGAAVGLGGAKDRCACEGAALRRIPDKGT